MNFVTNECFSQSVCSHCWGCPGVAKNYQGAVRSMAIPNEQYYIKVHVDTWATNDNSQEMIWQMLHASSHWINQTSGGIVKKSWFLFDLPFPLWLSSLTAANLDISSPCDRSWRVSYVSMKRFCYSFKNQSGLHADLTGFSFLLVQEWVSIMCNLFTVFRHAF